MATVTDIANSIRSVHQRLEAFFNPHGWSKDTPMTQLFGYNSLPMTCNSFGAYVEKVAKRVEKLTAAELERDQYGIFLARTVKDIDQLQFQQVNQNSSQLSTALSLLQLVQSNIPAPIPIKPKVDWEDLKEQRDLLPKDLTRRLRAVSAKIELLEPRSAEIEKKIDEIDRAHAAAEQLPADLEELSSQRDELKEIIDAATKLSASIEATNAKVCDGEGSFNQYVAETKDKFEKLQTTATVMINKSEQALRGSTGVGLANAFENRKKSLTLAGAFWTLGLIIALACIFAIGAERISALKEVLIADRPATIIWANALLAVFGVGAPVWFAWLSTKQIGVNFRLAEDYAFKASVSKAYEGYRTEAVQIDTELQRRLFETALTRIDEAPIRLLDKDTHSSPLHELLSNSGIRKSLEGIPNVTEKIIGLIKAHKPE